MGHLVKLSQYAATEQSPVRFLRWHAEVERRIRELGVCYTFLRPNLFFQGLLVLAVSIAAENRFFAPIGDARVSAVDVRDIAAVVAAALTEPGHLGRTYPITGPAAITHTEIASAIGAAVERGRDLRGRVARRIRRRPAGARAGVAARRPDRGLRPLRP